MRHDAYIQQTQRKKKLVNICTCHSTIHKQQIKDRVRTRSDDDVSLTRETFEMSINHFCLYAPRLKCIGFVMSLYIIIISYEILN